MLPMATMTRSLVRVPTQFTPTSSGVAYSTPSSCCCCCCCCIASVASAAIFSPVKMGMIAHQSLPGRRAALATLCSVLAIPLGIVVGILAYALFQGQVVDQGCLNSGDGLSAADCTSTVDHPWVGFAVGFVVFVGLQLAAAWASGWNRRAVRLAVGTILLGPVGFLIEAFVAFWLLVAIGWGYLAVAGLIAWFVGWLMFRKPRPNEPPPPPEPPAGWTVPPPPPPLPPAQGDPGDRE
jgi:hypothetical protein